MTSLWLDDDFFDQDIDSMEDNDDNRNLLQDYIDSLPVNARKHYNTLDVIAPVSHPPFEPSVPNLAFWCSS